MHEFAVWAPKAERMTLRIGETDYPMMGPDEQGWWRILVEAACDTDYWFLMNDDQQLLPDPRSKRMTNGVHGPSQLYDQDAFHWDDALWQGPPLGGAVIYELHIGTFTKVGTFDSALERLRYLAELGITHVEVMPIASFPGGFGWGYDGVGLFSVNEIYGGPDAFKRFVNACHGHGIGVLLDVVYNHFGPVGNYANNFGPYLTDKHKTPWGEAVNFEAEGSDAVRRFFCDNALMWMRDYHVDGLRLDAVHEFMDRSAIHFMEQLSAEVEVLSSTLGRRLVLIAESDLNDPRIVRPREAGGYGMDAQWSDDFHHSLFTVLYRGEEGKGYYDDFGSFDHLAKSLSEVFVYDGDYSIYRKRSHGRPVGGLSAHHFIGFIQNHDQVGNRAKGDRIAQIVGMDRAKMAAAIVLLAPFIPMLFQGEEYAASTPFQYFAHHDDPDMAAAVSAGRKKEFAAFGWNEEEIPDPEKPETFENSKLNWDEIHHGEHEEMLRWTKSLIHLRRHCYSLNDGDLGHVHVLCDGARGTLVMERGTVKLFCNLGRSPAAFDNVRYAELVLSSGEGVQLANDVLTVPPDGVGIVSKEKVRM